MAWVLATACVAALETWRWLRAVASQVREHVRQAMRSPQESPSCRDAVASELARAEAGEPMMTTDDLATHGSAEAASTTIRVRATRSSATNAAARRAVRQVREFLLANPTLAKHEGRPSHDAYDIVVEAFVFTEAAAAAGQPCPWRRARRPQDPSAARNAGSARALLQRLGWSRGAAWVRSKAMEDAWAVRDDGDSHVTSPIFTWELVEGLRLRPPRSPWELAGAAMAVLGTTHAKRGGGVKALKVGEVTQAAEDAVTVRARVRVKARAAATGKARGGGSSVVLRHWLIKRHVIPWLQWHRRHGSPDSALLFPSITARRSPAPTALGFEAEAKQWVEPLRQWSTRQVHDWLSLFIPGLNGRGFHGFRAGNNRELRRWKGEVHDVTRRALHERSLKPAIGSEAHYDETFAEDFAEATERLGRLRIERDDDSGLLTVTATSESAGEIASDWVSVARPIVLQPAGDDVSSSDTSSSSQDADEGEEAVVGDGGAESREYRCGRCNTAVGPRDYGFMCEVEDCTWGTCTACHPGGLREPLYCPKHYARKGR